MTRGRIAVQYEYGAPFELIEQDLPSPKPGWVSVRLHRAGICGSDLHFHRGEQAAQLGPIPAQGIVRGHEGFGVIEALGQGVDSDSRGRTVRVGDRIVFPGVFSCGRCDMCLDGRPNFCSNRVNVRSHAEYPFFTSFFADYLLLPPGHPMFLVPDALGDDALTSLNCAIASTADALVANDLRAGDSVVVFGAGGLGLSAAAFASYSGAAEIVVVDLQPTRLEAARRFGATRTIQAHTGEGADADVLRELLDVSGGRGFDLCLEVNGHPGSVVNGLASIRNGGTVITMGHIVAGSGAFVDFAALRRGKRLVGHSMYAPNSIPLVLDFLVGTRDRFPFGEMISSVFPLGEINAAFAAAEWHGRNESVATRVALSPVLG